MQVGPGKNRHSETPAKVAEFLFLELEPSQKGVGHLRGVGWQGEGPGTSETHQESKEAGAGSAQGRVGGRAWFSLLGCLSGPPKATLLCVALRWLGRSQIRELVGGLGQSLPTSQRCFRILPGKPAGGRSQ